MTDYGWYMARPVSHDNWPYGYVVNNESPVKGQLWLLDVDSGLKFTLDKLPDQARVRLQATTTTHSNLDIMSVSHYGKKLRLNWNTTYICVWYYCQMFRYIFTYLLMTYHQIGYGTARTKLARKSGFYTNKRIAEWCLKVLKRKTIFLELSGTVRMESVSG